MSISGDAFGGEHSAAPGDGAKHTAFQPLQHTAFQALEHTAFLKGLLKPFKGKGELVEFGHTCSQLTDSLVELAIQRVLAQAGRYPFTLLPVRLTRQSTGAGTVFLRWSRVDRSKMGVDLWVELIRNERTSINLVPDLYALELQRIVINMQISLTHSISRQAFLKRWLASYKEGASMLNERFTVVIDGQPFSKPFQTEDQFAKGWKSVLETAYGRTHATCCCPGKGERKLAIKRRETTDDFHQARFAGTGPEHANECHFTRQHLSAQGCRAMSRAWSRGYSSTVAANSAMRVSQPGRK